MVRIQQQLETIHGGGDNRQGLQSRSPADSSHNIRVTAAAATSGGDHAASSEVPLTSSVRASSSEAIIEVTSEELDKSQGSKMSSTNSTSRDVVENTLTTRRHSVKRRSWLVESVAARFSAVGACCSRRVRRTGFGGGDRARF